MIIMKRAQRPIIIAGALHLQIFADDLNDIRFLPRLSSIAHTKGYSIAEYAVKALMNRIEHPAATRQDIVLPVSYYDGGTCAGPVRLHRRPSDV